MHHFSYRGGMLHAEDVDLARLAGTVGTPFYCYSTATLERHYQVFAEAVGAGAAGRNRAHVFYAMKANSNLGVLAALARLGAGADTVSEGEIRKAMAAGIPASRIVFSGVGKTAAELAHAVDAGLYQVNIESEGELEALSRIAAGRGRRQAAVFRINPDVGAGGHAKITTGSSDNKFGVSFEEAVRLYGRGAGMAGVDLVGIAMHIGSQIRELGGFEAACRRMAELVATLRRAGHKVERVDLGGGLGIPYELEEPFEHGPDLIHGYADMVKAVFGRLDIELGFEPGRLIVGNAGVLVARVLYINPRPHKAFLVVDAAMNDLMRPAMYDAYHEIWPVRQSAAGGPRRRYDVVGPICETSDTFATERELPEARPGDLVAFMTAGAYGSSMSSTYNSRPLAAEVLVNGARQAVVRPRMSYEELIGQDRLPGWLA